MGSRLVSGLRWTAIERFSNQIIQLALSIIIARLISPEAYGVLAILLIFINISQVFIESGLGSALIFKNKEISKEDINTTFVFNLVVSVILCALIWIFSDSIQRFYDVEDLALFLRVSSVVLIINGLQVIPTSILKIEFDFKKLATSTLVSNFISAILGVGFAIYGFGVWALIIQMMSKSLILSIFLIIQAKWIPKFGFDKKSFLYSYKYGINIFATNILTKITDEGIASFIAKFLTPFNLGLFSRSGQFATFPTSFIGSLVTTVVFPAFAAVKNDKERYNDIFVNSLKLQAFLIIPLYLWLAVESYPIIILLLSEKWAGAVPIFQILCIGRVLALLAITTEQNLNASGRTDLCLKQQIFKLILKIILVAIALPFGIIAVALADALQTIAQFFITNKVAEKTIGFSVGYQFKLCLPYLTGAIIASIISYLSLSVSQNLFVQLLLSTTIGIVVYLFIILKCFKIKEPIGLIKRFVGC